MCGGRSPLVAPWMGTAAPRLWLKKSRLGASPLRCGGGEREQASARLYCWRRRLLRGQSLRPGVLAAGWYPRQSSHPGGGEKPPAWADVRAGGSGRRGKRRFLDAGEGEEAPRDGRRRCSPDSRTSGVLRAPARAGCGTLAPIQVLGGPSGCSWGCSVAAGDGHSCSSRSRRRAGLCSGVRVKQFFLITQGLCWARMALELGGMDGRSRDSANLINQVRNQPCKNPSRLAAASPHPPGARLVLSGSPKPGLVLPLPSCLPEQPGRWDATAGSVPPAPGTG